MRISIRRLWAATAAAAVLLLVPASAVGASTHFANWGWRHGATIVDLNVHTINAIVGLGLTPAALPPATLGGKDLSATFPITGQIKNGIIRHAGGLSLTHGHTVLTLRRFFINTKTAVLTARARVNGHLVGRIPLFDLGPAPAQRGCAATAELTLSSVAAGALTKVFGAPDLTGADFGDACVAPKDR